MRSLFLGILFILFIGIGGFMYRNAVEYPSRSAACQLDAKVCPDGTAVGRTGSNCTFPACPAPNVSLSDIGIAFALPEGLLPAPLPDSSSIAAYEMSESSYTSITAPEVIIRRYAIPASSFASTVIERTAIGGTSGEPVPQRLFSSIEIGERTFTVVPIERFEAVINTAYYLTRESDVLRFDAIDRDVLNWTEPNLDISKLPAHSALRGLLTTLQGG